MNKEEILAIANKKPEFKLRTFERFPEKSQCPICHTSISGECCLIEIEGRSDGRVFEVQPIHTGCLKLTYDPFNNLIYQRI